MNDEIDTLEAGAHVAPGCLGTAPLSFNSVSNTILSLWISPLESIVRKLGIPVAIVFVHFILGFLVASGCEILEEG